MVRTKSAVASRLAAGCVAVFAACGHLSAQTPAATLTIDLTQPGRPISPDLIGVFFEDLNYAADGGLYAELVQNRSFEYQATEQLNWTPMTAWEHVTRDGGSGSLKIADAVSAQVNLERIARIKSATRTVLAGAPTGSNTFEQPGVVAPVTDKLPAAKSFLCELPENSLTVLRLRTK